MARWAMFRMVTGSSQRPVSGLRDGVFWDVMAGAGSGGTVMLKERWAEALELSVTETVMVAEPLR